LSGLSAKRRVPLRESTLIVSVGTVLLLCPLLITLSIKHHYPGRHRLYVFSHRCIVLFQQLRRLGNFNSYLALLSALVSSPLSRLDWNKTVTDALREHIDVMDTTHSYKNYRILLQQSPPPTVPYMYVKPVCSIFHEYVYECDVKHFNDHIQFRIFRLKNRPPAFWETGEKRFSVVKNCFQK
uniref:Ras-GEF domain-containing protein n=1 Tax=Heligmosomoides polygyrus TaxID=6339 RepID=A0A183G942_HELPZ